MKKISCKFENPSSGQIGINICNESFVIPGSAVGVAAKTIDLDGFAYTQIKTFLSVNHPYVISSTSGDGVQNSTSPIAGAMDFPKTLSGETIQSSTTRTLVVLTGDGLWKDVFVPEGVECKACMVAVHTMDSANYGNFLPPGEYHYFPGTDTNPTEWIPMQSGPQPWAGKENAFMGRIRAASGKISILMMA